MFSIAKYVILNSRNIIVDGEEFLKLDHSLEFKEQAKKIYQSLEIDYPKFYKMDNLSKAAFISAELLLNQHVFNCDQEKIGLFISNKASSLETDEAYYTKTFEQDIFQANPALFVYTLPNIMMGELCIRHKIKGEQSMWVSDNLNANFVSKYVNLLFNDNLLETAVIGWVDLYQDKPETMLCLLEKKEENKNLEFNEENLMALYQKLKG